MVYADENCFAIFPPEWCPSHRSKKPSIQVRPVEIIKCQRETSTTPNLKSYEYVRKGRPILPSAQIEMRFLVEERRLIVGIANHRSQPFDSDNRSPMGSFASCSYSSIQCYNSVDILKRWVLIVVMCVSVCTSCTSCFTSCTSCLFHQLDGAGFSSCERR